MRNKLTTITGIAIIAILATSCGIRPVPVKDRNVVGKNDFYTAVPMTDIPETFEETEIFFDTVPIPETKAPQSETDPPTETNPVEDTDRSENTPETGNSQISIGTGSIDLSNRWTLRFDLPDPNVTFTLPENFYIRDLPSNWEEIKNQLLTYRTPYGGTVGIFSILGDMEYIEANTVGFYYIQNKGTGQYITRHDVQYKVKEYPYNWENDRYRNSYSMYDEKLTDSEYAGAQVFRMVELDKGYYAFLVTRHERESFSEMGYLGALTSLWHGKIECVRVDAEMLWLQSWILNETESGAYSFTTRYFDSKGLHRSLSIYFNFNKFDIGYEWYEGHDYLNEWYDIPLAYEAYTPDTNYNDEWLLIPYEP